MNQATQKDPNPDGRHALTILVAEDNRVNQLLARKALTSAGHKVVIAENGQAAVDLLIASDCRFDLILMDCQMPIMDGFQATALIRDFQSLGQLPRIPIVAVTAIDMDDDPTCVLPPGFDDYFVKPYVADDLIRIVARHTGGCTPEPVRQPDIPSDTNKPFDLAVLTSVSCGDPDLVEHFISVFRNDSDNCLLLIRNGMNSGDTATVRTAAHSLKGASGTLGAHSVFQLAKLLESFDGSGDELRRIVDQLADRLAECHQFSHLAVCGRSVETD